MLYFKNSELAEAYHVSLRTVLNWIEAAKKGKLDLLLHTHNGKAYVANTTRNITTIEELVEKRRKYRNTRSYKTVSPTSEFYELYNEQQVLDIISNLDTYHEIPFQYSYFEDGAKYWDQYVSRLATEKTPNSLNSTQRLLALNRAYIDSLFEGSEKVNVFDLGVGNAFPIREFIEHLLAKGIMGKYIAVDISKAMIAIARNNISNWFNNEIQSEGHELDFSYQRFHQLLVKESVESGDKATNPVLVLGGSLNNLRFPDAALHTIHESMSKSDTFIETSKLDTPNSRQYFDFNSNPSEARLADNDRLILDLLNIDESNYDVEMGFDSEKSQRYIRIRLKVALTIEFHLAEGEKLVKLNKEDCILLWRVWHQNSLEVIQQFEKNEFDVIQVSQSDEYLLTISKIKY